MPLPHRLSAPRGAVGKDMSEPIFIDNEVDACSPCAVSVCHYLRTRAVAPVSF